MPRCTCGNVCGRHLAHHLESAIDQIGPGLTRRLSQHLLHHAFEERLGATFEDVVGRLQTPGAGFGVVGGSLGIAEDERRSTPAMSAPEFEERVSPDRDANHGSAADVGIVQHAGEVGGVLLHGGRAFADF